MKLSIELLKTQLAEYETKCGTEGSGSILDFLWYSYSASNPIDDGLIKESEQKLNPVYQELSWRNSDILSNLVTDLCTAYQRAAFLEGILIGAHLSEELRGE